MTFRFSPRRPSAQVGRVRPRYRPTLEGLEDRLAPATFTVKTVADSPNPADFLTGLGAGNTGDLRYCIAQADNNPGTDEIVFALPANSVIRLSQMMRPITDPAGLSIRGNTAAGLTISGDANNSGTNDAGDVRVFFVMNGAVVGLNDLTIAGGRAQGGAGGSGGGG